ncbi:MAG: GAP family protein [Anaerolineae bacterium]
MGDTIVGLLPVMIGATLVPVYPIMVLLLLQSDQGLLKAAAFVAGAVLVRLLQGVLFGFVFGRAADAYPADGPDIIASTLLLVLGILLLVAAYRKWRKEADPDDPPPKWMTAITGLSVGRAFGAGALVVALAFKQWVFTLTALDVIEAAALGRQASIGLYLFYTLVTQTFVLIPLAAMAVAPQHTAKPLQAAQGWLERYNRPIMIAVSLVFGVWFLYKGIAGLVGW